MSRYVDGLRMATRAYEAAAWQDGIAVTCSTCGHHAVHDPHGLWWLCVRRGWDDDFRALRTRFYCVVCRATTGKKVRPESISLTRASATITLPPPPAREWKKALKRMRT